MLAHVWRLGSWPPERPLGRCAKAAWQTINSQTFSRTKVHDQKCFVLGGFLPLDECWCENTCFKTSPARQLPRQRAVRLMGVSMMNLSFDNCQRKSVPRTHPCRPGISQPNRQSACIAWEQVISAIISQIYVVECPATGVWWLWNDMEV